MVVYVDKTCESHHIQPKIPSVEIHPAYGVQAFELGHKHIKITNNQSNIYRKFQSEKHQKTTKVDIDI